MLFLRFLVLSFILLDSRDCFLIKQGIQTFQLVLTGDDDDDDDVFLWSNFVLVYEGISAIVSSLVCGLLKDRLSQRSFFFVTVLTNFIRVIGAIVVELLIGEMHATSSLILFSFIFFIEAAYFALGNLSLPINQSFFLVFHILFNFRE